MKTIRAWYFSAQRIVELVKEGTARNEIIRVLERANGPFAGGIIGNFIGEPVVKWIEENKIQPFHKLAALGLLKVGSVFTYDGHFYGKGFGSVNKTGIGSLSEDVSAYILGQRLVIEFGLAGITTDTAYTRLSGSTSLFALCTITKIDSGVIQAIPYVIGDLIESNEFGLDLRLRNTLRISLPEVDQFKSVDFLWNPTPAKFNKLKDVSEQKVKEVFCKLLGEIDVPKDWGGEESDIFSGNMSMDGQRFTSAFLLKGPARFHEMTMADCGKNGDQIYRLFNTPAEIFVIQHCHKIQPSVRRTVEAFAASEYSRNCRYIIIDGYDTCRILRSHGVLT
jgi:hypothetical protein